MKQRRWIFKPLPGPIPKTSKSYLEERRSSSKISMIVENKSIRVDVETKKPMNSSLGLGSKAEKSIGSLQRELNDFVGVWVHIEEEDDNNRSDKEEGERKISKGDQLVIG